MLFAGGVSSLQSTLTPEAMWDGGLLAPILTIFVIPLLPHLATCIASRANRTRVPSMICEYLFLFYFSLVFRALPPQALLAPTWDIPKRRALPIASVLCPAVSGSCESPNARSIIHTGLVSPPRP